jgi:hypothetical protein
MNKAKWFLSLFVFFVGQALAMPGVFDRSAEIEQYIQQLGSDLTQEQLIDVAKPIYVSGITDERLSKAVGDRLLKDLPTLGKNSESTQYAAWMVKALGSTGTDTAATLIKEVRAKTTSQRVRSECDDQLNELPWQRRKNEVMSSRENHNEGDKMRVSQMLNLLKSDDYSFKQDAAYRMSWDRVLDDRLMQEIAKQTQAFVEKNNGASKDKAEIVVMSHYVKMLGYSYDNKYRPVLMAVLQSKADSMVQRQAKKAIKRLS